MSRGPDFEPRESLPKTSLPQKRGHERFSLKSERGDGEMAGMIALMIAGHLLIGSVILYPVISDQVFGKRVENYCIPTGIVTGPARCYQNVTPLEDADR